MKTLDELKAFCEGFRTASLAEESGDLSQLDEWLTWCGYQINIFGEHWGIRIEGDKTALSVDVYPQRWKDGQLPDALHTFDLVGQQI